MIIKNKNKIVISYVLILLIFFIISISSALAIFKERNLRFKNLVWDGTIAQSFNSGDGSETTPYIISNGSELAYLSVRLESEDFSNTYFQLSNDIVLNDGKFIYDNEVKYKKDFIYTMKENENNLYLDNEVKDYVNIFPSLNNFKGTFDGNDKQIFGLYLTGENSLGLFTNLSGNVSNLNITNALSYGGFNTSILAAESNNSNISNILVDGIVMGSTPMLEEKDLTLDNTFVYQNETLNLSNYLSNDFGYDNLHIEGNYSITNNISELTINDQLFNTGSFSMDLNDLMLNLSLNSTETEEITFSNVKVSYIEKKGTSSSLIAHSQNDKVSNISTYTTVFGNINSSGLTGKAESIDAENILISSNITGNYITAGLSGYIYGGVSEIKNVVVKEKFNSSNTGSLSSLISDSTVNINNVYLYSDYYAINEVLASTVNVNNSYMSGGSNTALGATNNIFLTDDLTETMMFNTLQYDTNIWTYDNLYLNKDYNYIHPVNIKLLENTYDKFENYTNKIFEKEDITLNAEFKNLTNTVDNISYYLSNDYLSEEDLDLLSFTLYDSDITVAEEGSYVLYLKIENNNSIYYINTPKFILDKTLPSININSSNKSWSLYNENPVTINYTEDISINVETQDAESGLKSSKYYIDNNILTKEELDTKTFTTINGDINIAEKGSYIVYIKAEDKSGNIKYANTDILYYDGFVLNSFNVGEFDLYNGISKIDKNSKVKYNFTYAKTSTFLTNEEYFIYSLNKLPDGVKLILIDNKTNNSYMHVTSPSTNFINDNGYYYNFNNFSLIGAATNTLLDKQITANIDDDYTLIIDYKNSNVTENLLSNKINLAIRNNTEVVLSTLKNNKTYDIYGSSVMPSLDVDLLYNFEELVLNSDSINNIDITPNLLFDNNITNTNFEKYNTYLRINITNNNGKVLRESLKNIKFKISNKQYYFNYNNDVIIKVDNPVTLNVITSQINNVLNSGNYNLNISLFTGLFKYNVYNESEIVSIPLTVKENKKEANLEVTLDETIISKDKTNHLLNINTSLTETVENPKILVSLYEKKNFQANNQEYLIKDLNTYITNKLPKEIDDVYLYSSEQLNLDMSKFNYNSYKIVFSLYSGDKKVDEVSKYFIIK